MALPADPLIRGSGEDRRTTADLRRAPPSKEARTCTKSTTGDPTSSMAPPVEDLTNPTLSTPVKRGSPALPPPERPTENEGSGETTARRWICGRGEKSPLSTVAGERRRPGEKLKKLEEEKGIIIRFMIGHSHAANNALDKAIEVEDAIHHDFLRLDHVEGYHKLTAKNKTFFSTVVASWDADFYIKVDDDIHVNLGHDGIRLIRN